MTLPNQPPSRPEGGYSVDATTVAPVSVSSPLASLVVEKKRASALSLLLGFALVVAVGGVAFAAGRLTAPASTTAAGTGRGGGGTGTGFGGGGTGFQPGASGQPGGFGGAAALGGAGLTITGTVQAISPTSITLKTAQGATVDIPIDTATTYHGQAAATAGDVRTGAQVQIEIAGGFAGGIGRGGGQGGTGAGGGTGVRPTAPPAVGGPGASPSPGAGATGGTGGFGGRGAIGPATDITVVTP